LHRSDNIATAGRAAFDAGAMRRLSELESSGISWFYVRPSNGGKKNQLGFGVPTYPRWDGILIKPEAKVPSFCLQFSTCQSNSIVKRLFFVYFPRRVQLLYRSCFN
jgi:hypothetical protein